MDRSLEFPHSLELARPRTPLEVAKVDDQPVDTPASSEQTDQ